MSEDTRKRQFEKEFRHYVDSEGRLWHGPCAPDDNLHYARCEGICNFDGSLIWVLRRSAKGNDWKPFSTNPVLVVEDTGL